jgi:hypothetical protein
MFSKIEKSSVVAVALAITFAFGFSAFKAPVNHTPESLSQSWFRYDGGDVNLPANYTELGSIPTECEGDGDLCAILAEENENSGKPTQSGVMNPVETKKYD